MKTLVLSVVFGLGLLSINSYAITDLADLTGQTLKPDCPRTHETAIRNINKDIISETSIIISDDAGEVIQQ